jgi:integrase
MNSHDMVDDLQIDAGTDRTYALSDNANRGGTADTARPWTEEGLAPMSTTQSTPLRVRVDRNLYVRPTGVFEAIYRDSIGKQRLRTLKAKTLREARKELTALLGQRDRAEDVAPSRATLNDLADRFFEEYESKVARGERSQRSLDTTRQRYDTHVRKSLGLRKAQDIRSGSVSNWLADLRKTSLSNYTVRGIVTVVSAVFTKAVRDEAVQANPVAKLRGTLPPAKAATEARVLTADQIAKLIDSAPKRFVTLVATACFTGLRQSELLGLRWGDVDFENGVLHIRQQLSRATKDNPAHLVPLKTGAGVRSIELAPGLAKELKTLKAAALGAGHHTPDSFVFCTSEGTPLYYRNVNHRALDKAADRAGLNPEGTQKLSWHDLRHTAGSLLLDAGEDIVTVSRFLGHSKVSITLDIYAHQIERTRGNGAGSRLGAVLGGAL